MRAFKGKRFARWAKDERIGDEILLAAAVEALAGQVEADLGGYLFKKRVARRGAGKSGGYRTILGFRKGANRVFFLFGFPKSERATVTPREQAALSLVAASLVHATDSQFAALILNGDIFEVEQNDE